MTDKKTPSLSPEARRLEEIRRTLGGDHLLNYLVQLASGEQFSISVPIILMVDGALVRGQMIPPQELVHVLDAHLIAALQEAPINVTGQAEPDSESELRSVLTKALDRTFERVNETRERRIERGHNAIEKIWGPVENWDEDRPPSLDEIPDEFVGDAVAAMLPPHTVTLRDGEVLISSTGRWVSVGYMRIVLSHVSAWCFATPVSE